MFHKVYNSFSFYSQLYSTIDNNLLLFTILLALPTGGTGAQAIRKVTEYVDYY